jgi:hypothetical protein
MLPYIYTATANTKISYSTYLSKILLKTWAVVKNHGKKSYSQFMQSRIGVQIGRQS